jgi:hypothetical protein
MALPTVADSLAGRMETLTLLPLSQSEMVGSDANWIDHAFSGRILNCAHPILDNQLIEQVLRGGFPEALTRTTVKKRCRWASISGLHHSRLYGANETSVVLNKDQQFKKIAAQQSALPAAGAMRTSCPSYH